MVFRNTRNLHNEHPEIYQKSMKGNFVVKTKPGSLNAMSTDIADNQKGKKKKKKSEGGIIGQTRKASCVKEWQLSYHDVLTIRNAYHDMTSGRINHFITNLAELSVNN